MFDIAPSELLLVAVVALVVIGPKDLPRAMRVVGHWVGRARAMSRHFRSGIDTMMREAELDEMQRHWQHENARIMREHPVEEDEAHGAGDLPRPLPAPEAAPEIAPVVDAPAAEPGRRMRRGSELDDVP